MQQWNSKTTPVIVKTFPSNHRFGKPQPQSFFKTIRMVVPFLGSECCTKILPLW